tara:strand:- start:3921 stop:4235 length:315 start_codon:yes stop_codon:yes gene_type:complete
MPNGFEICGKIRAFIFTKKSTNAKLRSSFDTTSLGDMTRMRLDNPDLPRDDMMACWPETIGVLLRHRMLCVGCLVAPFHTPIDAYAKYGLDIAALNADLIAVVR